MSTCLHFHSDCPFFAGCENMLINLWGSQELRQSYEISFSYRSNQPYEMGLNSRIVVDFPIYSLKIWDPSLLYDLAPNFPKRIRRIFMPALQLFCRYPVFIYDVLVLIRLFRQINPEILHINNGGYPGALSCRAAAIAGRICGIPNIIMVVNNLAIAYEDFNRWFDYPIDFLVSFSVTKFVTGSRAASGRLTEVLSVSKDNVVSLHNGINLRKSTEETEETRKRLGISNFNGVLFGVVALMERRKGHQILLDALNIIADNDPNDLSQMLVLLEGDGPTRKQLEEFVNKHQLKERVKFVGAENNVVNFMRALDVVVLPSIDQEDFPNVVLEAMSLGKPVIASRLAGTPEQIVPNLTGLLVEPGDSAALANALLRMANDKELCQRLGANGRIRFEENFTAKMAVQRYLDLYKELAGA